MNYFIGVVLAIGAGISNFLGQVLQKKAINDVKIGDEVAMKKVVKKPLWILGILCVVVFSAVLSMFAQNYIGPVLTPGLCAAGLIVLAIGSVKILGERLKKEEWIAVVMVIAGVALVAASKLSINTDLDRFKDIDFVIRLSVASAILIALWLGLFYGGKKLKKHKSIVMAIASGMPFALGNIWMFAIVNSVGELFAKNFSGFNIAIFFISGILMGATQILGLVHVSKTLATGNASIVVPIQQIPQQLMPIITYFAIFALPAPSSASYFFISGGIVLIVVAGFLLGKRQAALENIAQAPQSSDTENAPSDGRTSADINVSPLTVDNASSNAEEMHLDTVLDAPLKAVEAIIDATEASLAADETALDAKGIALEEESL
jgi:drug/metabolite transporter (DMT)-like permease